jgi:hypothetical protein
MDKKKRTFVRPRIVRRREKLATIVQFATGGRPQIDSVSENKK